MSVPGTTPQVAARSDRVATLLVLLAALVMGGYWLLMMPPWQHNDEPTHFEYAWLLANWGQAGRFGPDARDLPMQRELIGSMVANHFYSDIGQPPPYLFAREADAPFFLGFDETVHPPLYFRLVALPLRALSHLDLTSQLLVARGVSLLLFLLIIAGALGAMRELTPPGHPLRWAAPLVMVMWAPFANHMTAVNNDVAAVLAVTLFLWAVARMIRVGVTVLNMLALVGAGLLGLAVKTTASIVLVLVPFILLAALWRRRGWRWRTLLLPLSLLALLLLLVLFTRSGAANWYRAESPQPVLLALRTARPDSPDGRYVLQNEGQPTRAYLANELPERYRRSLIQNGATVGGWVWADQQVEGRAPGLMTSREGSIYNEGLTEPMTIPTVPTLAVARFTVPPDVGRLAYQFWTIQPDSSANRFYLDGAFVIEGMIPEGADVQVQGDRVVVDGVEHPNLLRNPSAEQAGWEIRPQIESLLYRYARRSPTFVLRSLLDTQVSVPLLRDRILPVLTRNLFGAFAWGQIIIARSWNPLGWLLAAVGALGGVAWLLRYRGPDTTRFTLLFWLMLLALGWANALLWPLAYQGARLPVPSARYLHPMALVMALMLAGGWWALWPRRFRRMGLAALFALLLLFNVVSARTIQARFAPHTSIPSLAEPHG